MMPATGLARPLPLPLPPSSSAVYLPAFTLISSDPTKLAAPYFEDA